ncbi:uncharacterized protein LOC141849507 [Brevipalpus obovatus]|uniref:uncharacterized protein LOC141849507 n=1 Tax=Brevipalpus obovatus TaxID=246614 RepID=UPI003D9ED0D3
MTLEMDVNLASRLSGILLDSDNRNSISFDEWFGVYQDASRSSDDYCKYLAKMVVKKIEPNPLKKVLKIQTHCVGETCSIVKNLKIDCENASQIVIWLREQLKQSKVYQCGHHCACDTLQLLIFFTNNFDVILTKICPLHPDVPWNAFCV